MGLLCPFSFAKQKLKFSNKLARWHCFWLPCSSPRLNSKILNFQIIILDTLLVQRVHLLFCFFFNSHFSRSDRHLADGRSHYGLLYKKWHFCTMDWFRYQLIMLVIALSKNGNANCTKSENLQIKSILWLYSLSIMIKILDIFSYWS